MTRLTLEQCDDIHELIEAMAENQEQVFRGKQTSWRNG